MKTRASPDLNVFFSGRNPVPKVLKDVDIHVTSEGKPRKVTYFMFQLQPVSAPASTDSGWAIGHFRLKDFIHEHSRAQALHLYYLYDSLSSSSKKLKFPVSCAGVPDKAGQVAGH